MADAASEETGPPDWTRPERTGDTPSPPRRIRASRRQLAVLFAYSLVNWSAGNGLLPLLPKYAKLLGADPVLTGVYLGISYAAIAVGTVVAGWLADRVGHRRGLMVLVGLAIPPLLIVLSAVSAFWQAVAIAATIWWLAGMALTFASILAGLSAGPAERGRVLGILAVAAPTGSIIGGLGIGILADRVGFSTMWIVLGFLYLLCPAAGLLVQDVPTPPKAAASETATPEHPGGAWNAAFLILLACGVLAASGSFIGSLGRTFAMQNSFTNEELTSTVAVSGLVTLPFPFLVGTLSDRLGRLRFLGLCYAAGAAGLVVYAGAAVLWEFWLATAFVAFVSYVSTGVGSALVVDLVDRPAIGRGLALFGATGWVGGVLGFLAGGYLFQGADYAAGFIVGATLLVATILLLPPIALAIRRGRRSRPDPRSVPSAARKE